MGDRIEYKVRVCKFKDMDSMQLPETRGGAFLTFVDNGKINFIVGIDTKSGLYTNFGGGISFLVETLDQGIRREVSEETDKLVEMKYGDLDDCITSYSLMGVIAFKFMSEGYLKYLPAKYKEKVGESKKHKEIKEMVIMEWDEFWKNILDEEKTYRVISILLSDTKDQLKAALLKEANVSLSEWKEVGKKADS